MEEKILELLKSNHIGHAKRHYLKHELLLLFNDRRELLIDFTKSFRYQGEKFLDVQIQSVVDEYLKANNAQDD